MKLLEALRVHRETVNKRGASFHRERKDENGNTFYCDLLIHPSNNDAYNNFVRDYLKNLSNPDHLSLVDSYKYLDLGVSYLIHNPSIPDVVNMEKDLSKY